MAIDPIYISLDGVPEFQMLGGEASLSPETRARLDAVRRSPGVAYADVRSLKDDALRAVYDRFMSAGAGGRRRPRADGVREISYGVALVAGRLRAVSRAARASRASRVVDVGSGAAGARAGRARSRPRGTGARDPLLRVPAVARRGSVARGARGVRAGRAVWRSAVHGGRGQRRRVGESGDVRAGSVGGHAAGCVQRDRPGLGPARVSLGRGRRRRISAGCAIAPAARASCSTASASIT